jgi:RHS repeat-associated protein
VDTLVQQYRTGMMATHGDNRFKVMTYQYDLISGKVNQVHYQPGQPDQYYHRYAYDAENRITDVYTTTNKALIGSDVLEEHEAYYAYYKHGPLARTILGQQQVQGGDYAYTLQGWLKGVNSMALDTARDMGKDGGLTARDAYGFQLNYFTGDYLPINASRNPFPGHSAFIGTSYRPLYNGNISSMGVNIGKLNQPQLYNYVYDQLNRLVSMQAWRGFNSATNSWSAMAATTDHQENITYDGNGNILSYFRNGNTSAGKPLDMDKLAYYYAVDGSGNKKNNQLLYVYDTVALATNYTEDIDRQSVGNYEYDSIGNLTRDNAEKISAITWNVYGKISQITKNTTTVVGDLQLIRYGYDASGNRIRKTAYYNQDATNYRAAHTWYVRDASGNVMATYTSAGLMPKNSTRDTTSKVPLYLSELHMYGSSRLGIWSRNVNMDVLPTGGGTVALLGSAGIDTFNRGNKFFELSNHLGNVLVTVSDRKIGQSPVNNLYTSFTADVVSATDYAPFGMQMVGRTFSAGAYRYGFNGKENADEITTGGYAFEARVYNSRIGRFLSYDPRQAEYPWQSTYAYYRNSPISTIDFLGMGDYYDKNGQRLGSDGKTKKITIGKGKKAVTKEIADDKAYIATSVRLNDKGLVESAEGLVELKVSNSVLNQLANTTAEESSGNKYESYAIASAIINLSNYKGKDIATILRTEDIYGYGAGGNSTKYKNNAEFSMQAALNAVLGGQDYSNGAIRWDGFDLAIKGWGHIKSTNQGIGISKTHLETFKNYWSTGNNLTSTSGDANAVYNSAFIINGNASLTYSVANNGMWKGMVLYASSAAYGGTIFWKATPVFTIHGINLNANYEKVKGRTNKPL